MSFDPNNPTAIIKDGLIFAAISQVVAFATRRVSEFADELLKQKAKDRISKMTTD